MVLGSFDVKSMLELPPVDVEGCDEGTDSFSLEIDGTDWLSVGMDAGSSGTITALDRGVK